MHSIHKFSFLFNSLKKKVKNVYNGNFFQLDLLIYRVFILTQPFFNDRA